MARNAYEFEKITCASGMFLFDSYVFLARSIYEGKRKFVTPCSIPTSIAQCITPTYDLCYAFDHNSDLPNMFA